MKRMETMRRINASTVGSVLRRPIVTLVGKPMISILLKVKTVYIHESPDKTTVSLSRRRADLITYSGMTNRRVEARASVQQLELATNIPRIHHLIWFLRNPFPPSTVRPRPGGSYGP
jgi:hypothetical protein